MIYFLILLGFILYIFIAGLVNVWLRLQYFSLINERDFSYSIMEQTTEPSIVEHCMAIIWPVTMTMIFAFYMAEKIYRIRSKT